MLIILPIFLSLLLHLPSVQNYIVQKATQIISSKIETKVSIEKIGIKLFNKVVIDGLYVEDYGGDTLIYVNQLSAGVANFGILKGDLALSSVNLDGTRFNMRQMDSGISNLKEILNKLKSDKPKSNSDFTMRVGALNINELWFSFRKLKPREREYGVNFDDLDIRHFMLKASHISIINDSISLAINNISLRDKSGFDVKTLAADKFTISGTGMLFDRLNIKTTASELNADYLYFTYSRWNSMSNFLTDVNIKSKIANSTVSYSTIAYFAPSLRDWKSCYTNVTASVDGPISAMEGTINQLDMNDTRLSANYGLYGIPDIDNTRFNIDITKLETNIDDIDFIVSDITGHTIKGDNKMFEQLGTVGLKGTFDGLLTRFKANAQLTSDVGDVKLDMSFAPDKTRSSSFSGYLEALDVNLGKLLTNKQLGRATLKANVDGNFENKKVRAQTKASLSKLEFNSYTYSNIKLNGLIDNRTYKGLITSADPNINFDFNGLLDFTDSLPSYDFDMHLMNADLHKLNFNKRDSISLLSCNVKASARGNNMDNVNGKVTIDNLLYVNPIDSVRTGDILLVGDNDANHKSLGLYSSFADIEFKSRLGYQNMFNYLQSVLEEYLPNLTAPTKTSHIQYSNAGSAADLSGYSLLKIDVKQANNVAGIFLPGLQFAQGTKLSFMFNPDARKFSLSASSDYIERNNFFVSKLSINSRNQADSLSLFVRADDVFVGGLYMPNFSIIGGARDNEFSLSTKFNDPKTGLNALIGLNAEMEKDSATMAPQVRIRIAPSTISNNKNTWRVSARDIIYDTTQISIKSFRILSSGQELLINGVASRDTRDTLHVSLKDFDLGPFSQLTNRMGYTISGITNGHADITSAMKEASIYARITMDSMKVNNVSIPSSLFVSAWDSHTERAKVQLTTEGNPQPVVIGYYRPNDGRYLVDINMNDIDLSLIDPVLSGVLKNSKGTANTKLTLTGTKGKPSLNGEINVNRLETTVDYTNVTYTIKEAVIDVKDNNFALRTTHAYDVKGNSAELDMTLGSNYFSNLHYNINIRPKNLMVINTGAADNDLFYGTIFASGAAQIKGDKRGVNMNIVATTDDNSAFYMPLSGKANISKADFIVFETHDNEIDSTNYLVRKRMMFERKNKVNVAAKSNMNINMALTVKPNTDFQLVIDPTVGDILKGRGNGLLNIHINPGDGVFSMYGDYQITEGSYLFTLQNIINKKFIIQQGSTIKWTGEPLDALLDITAIYKLKASLAPLLNSGDENFRRSVPVDCEIHFAERLSQPAITFDVQVQNVDPETQSLVANALNTQEMMATQFFWLLAVNSFYADSGANQSMNIGAMGGSVTGFEFLSNQLSNWVSSDKYNIGIRYRPKGELNSDELDIGLSTAIIDNRLLLEVEGNYDFGNNTTMNNRTANSLTGDFYLTWLIDRSGSLKAKAFSRTIDRFDENQGLQESGLGLYYKEDFNTFKDILTNFKERFKRKNKTK